VTQAGKSPRMRIPAALKRFRSYGTKPIRNWSNSNKPIRINTMIIITMTATTEIEEAEMIDTIRRETTVTTGAEIEKDVTTTMPPEMVILSRVSSKLPSPST
jgi:hypothetical protein